MSNIIRRLSRGSSSKSLRSNDSSASSSASFTASSLTQNIVNSQEINIAQIESQLHNWSIPHMKINTIYQQGNSTRTKSGLNVRLITVPTRNTTRFSSRKWL